MKRFFLTFFTILLLTPLSGGFITLAAEPDALAPFQAESDFETRRLALGKVFELTQTEINDLALRLKDLAEPADVELALVYKTFQKDLKSYADLINSRIKELQSDYLTLEGVRVMADNFKKWREAVYDPEIQEIFDFLLMTQGDLILSIADVRYQKIAADVEKLKLEGATMVILRDSLAKANTHLTSGHALRVQAGELFLSSFKQRHVELTRAFKKIAPAVDTLQASTLDTVAPVTPTEQVAEPTVVLPAPEPETVQTFMQRCIDEISSAYKLFLQMRDIVLRK